MVGEAWKCPHCGERILRSALTCPACRRHLRFDAVTTARPGARPTLCPLTVEGTIRHSDGASLSEYSVIIEVREDRGELIARHRERRGSRARSSPAHHAAYRDAGAGTLRLTCRARAGQVMC